MAIFTSADFASYIIEVPTTETSNPITDNGVISIIQSDSVVQTVFDSLSTALKCLNFMNSRNQYYLMAGDELTIINCQTKLLILENTFINQKLLNSYVLTYHANKIMCVHRNLSNLFNLTDAMVSVGFKVSSGTTWNTNADLETNVLDANRPRIKVVDWFYFIGTGSLLSDTNQIITA